MKNHQSDEDHPHAYRICPHDVLGKSAVLCLAVSCVIADLEHGRLHVVAVESRLRYYTYDGIKVQYFFQITAGFINFLREWSTVLTTKNRPTY